jgi:hypothetical protein
MRDNMIRFKQLGWTSRKSQYYSRRHYLRDLRRLG